MEQIAVLEHGELGQWVVPEAQLGGPVSQYLTVGTRDTNGTRSWLCRRHGCRGTALTLLSRRNGEGLVFNPVHHCKQKSKQRQEFPGRERDQGLKFESFWPWTGPEPE